MDCDTKEVWKEYLPFYRTLHLECKALSEWMGMINLVQLVGLMINLFPIDWLKYEIVSERSLIIGKVTRKLPLVCSACIWLNLDIILQL